MEMMFVSQDLRNISPAASSFSLFPPGDNAWLGGGATLGLWGWGWRTPLSVFALVFTKGRKTKPRRLPKVSHGQAWARAGEGVALSGWKARASPDGFAHYPHMARGDVESDGFWELCLAQE